jgi:hypothetical protein
MGEPPFDGAVHYIDMLVLVVLVDVGAFGFKGAVARITPRT